MEITRKDVISLAFTILEENNNIKYTKKYNKEYLIEGLSQSCVLPRWKWFNFKSSGTFSRQMGRLINKPKGIFWETYFFSIVGYNQCNSCGEIKEISEFKVDNTERRGYSSMCKNCSNKYNSSWYFNNKDERREYLRKYMATRRVLKLNAIPNWITKKELEDIDVFYTNCPKGYHVDHIIPLKGKLVCGLHVLDNLQYLLAHDNLVKSNKFDIIDFNKN